MSGPRLAFSIPGCIPTHARASTTSHLVLTQAAAPRDSPPPPDGILFVLSRNFDFMYFRRWLTLGSIGHGCWDAGLYHAGARAIYKSGSSGNARTRTTEHQRWSCPYLRRQGNRRVFSLQFLELAYSVECQSRREGDSTVSSQDSHQSPVACVPVNMHPMASSYPAPAR